MLIGIKPAPRRILLGKVINHPEWDIFRVRGLLLKLCHGNSYNLGLSQATWDVWSPYVYVLEAVRTLRGDEA